MHAPRMACCSSSFAYFILTVILWFAAATTAPVYAAEPPLSEQGDWAPGGTGDVEVDLPAGPLTLREGESLTYRMRLTSQPLASVAEGEWWVRIRMNGVIYIDGVYPPGNFDDAMILVGPFGRLGV